MRVFQVPVTALLAAATYYAYKCPCKNTLSCHKKEFFSLVGGATALVLLENGLL